MPRDILDTILLLALPASGKSEVRKYLRHLSPEEARRDFHMGASAQLDDFPYVHLMRRVDDELAAAGGERVYFLSPDRPFRDPKDWLTLIELVNEDYADLAAARRRPLKGEGLRVLDRLDAASLKAGAPARLKGLKGEARARLAEAIEKDAAEALAERQDAYPETLEGRTLVIEFARGGPQGSSLPFPDSFGYRASIARLDPRVLERAAILYVWVTPEESRRKNAARADPNDPGSILHHSVPLEVMLNDYGLDDMDWLESSARKPGTVAIEAHGRVWDIPVARFDNRVDKTSFLREDAKYWKPAAVAAVHEGLRTALERLARA